MHECSMFIFCKTEIFAMHHSTIQVDSIGRPMRSVVPVDRTVLNIGQLEDPKTKASAAEIILLDGYKKDNPSVVVDGSIIQAVADIKDAIFFPCLDLSCEVP